MALCVATRGLAECFTAFFVLVFASVFDGADALAGVDVLVEVLVEVLAVWCECVRAHVAGTTATDSKPAATMLKSFLLNMYNSIGMNNRSTGTNARRDVLIGRDCRRP